MPKFTIAVTQSFKAYRTIYFEVEAEDKASAVAGVSGGSLDVPEFNDPRWHTVWDLMDEEVS